MKMATKNDSQNETVVKRKPRNPKGSPLMGDNGLTLEPGDNSKYLNIGMRLMKLPSIDVKDADAVNSRLDEFFAIHFENDMKPTVSGMAMALGMTRQTLSAIRSDLPTGGTGYKSALPKDVTDSIKKAYVLMENLWENYMQNGKINPVSGIFLGKNNFGYQDKTEYVLTPNQQSTEEYDVDEIKRHFMIDSDETKR
jgi:hypothetical protein